MEKKFIQVVILLLFGLSLSLLYISVFYRVDLGSLILLVDFSLVIIIVFLENKLIQNLLFSITSFFFIFILISIFIFKPYAYKYLQSEINTNLLINKYIEEFDELPSNSFYYNCSHNKSFFISNYHKCMLFNWNYKKEYANDLKDMILNKKSLCTNFFLYHAALLEKQNISKEIYKVVLIPENSNMPGHIFLVSYDPIINRKSWLVWDNNMLFVFSRNNSIEVVADEMKEIHYPNISVKSIIERIY
jgi:hypothetical protein